MFKWLNPIIYPTFDGCTIPEKKLAKCHRLHKRSGLLNSNHGVGNNSSSMSLAHGVMQSSPGKQRLDSEGQPVGCGEINPNRWNRWNGGNNDEWDGSGGSSQGRRVRVNVHPLKQKKYYAGGTLIRVILNRAKVVSFPHSVIPAFCLPNFFLVIFRQSRKIPPKMDSQPLFMGGVSPKICEFFLN